MPLITTTGFPFILIEQRHFAAQADMILLRDRGGQHRRDPGVHRVAALFQNAIARLHFQLLPAPIISCVPRTAGNMVRGFWANAGSAAKSSSTARGLLIGFIVAWRTRSRVR